MPIATITPNKIGSDTILVRETRSISGASLLRARGTSKNRECYKDVNLRFDMEGTDPTLEIDLGGIRTPFALRNGVDFIIGSDKFRVKLS